MDEFLKGSLFILRVSALCAASGASAALGFALVCQWLKWAPVNIIVNVYTTPNTDLEVSQKETT